VYKGLDIGTAKPTQRERKGIPHHLLDVVSPEKRYTVVQYQKTAKKAIQEIHRKDKLPFLVGGSPLYVYVVTDGWTLPKVRPNIRLRAHLEKYTVAQLLQKLKKLDPRRAKTIEQKNKRRLIRALEIIHSTGKTVPRLKMDPLPYLMLFLGVQKSSQELQSHIQKRFLSMLKRGFLGEIKALHKLGISWHRIEEFGLEYREGAQYLQGNISRNKMIEQAIKATVDFARRQMIWFKKDPRISWIKNQREAESLLRKFLSVKN